MKRIGIYKVHTTSALTWLHDWLYRMATEELRTGYEVKDLSPHFSLGDFSLQEWLAEFPEEGAKIKEEDYDALRNMSDEMFKTKLNILLKMRGFAKGYLSDLYVNEKLLAIFTLSRYGIDLDQNPLIKNVLLDFPSISIKCYDVGEGKTQIVLYYFPELEKVVDQLWQDIPFEARGESASAVIKQNAVQADSGIAENVKKNGRYRLSSDEIKFRRQKVKEANKDKKQNPLKRWDEIDFEFSERLNIPKDSFRRWRHNNY